MPDDKKNWSHISDDDHDAYLWRLGNLTLLNSNVNIGISNNKFDDKKKHYTDSKIEENIAIANKQKWDIDEIETRQKELCKTALTLWTK